MTDQTKEARNSLGHFEDCNYWDWPDLSKCNCAAGLAGANNGAGPYQISPIPLRDHFACAVTPSDEEALNLAMAEFNATNAIHLVNKKQAPTIGDIIIARARLRYIEADAMIEVRKAKPETRRSEEAKENPEQT